jgi:hypothetical protein
MMAHTIYKTPMMGQAMKTPIEETLCRLTTGASRRLEFEGPSWMGALLLVGYLDFRSSGFAEVGPLIGPTTMCQVCKAPEQQQEYSTKMIRRVNA